ncbi:MAG: nuclear transport factor 2 family protein [Pseudanabaena sp. ELA607]
MAITKADIHSTITNYFNSFAGYNVEQYLSHLSTDVISYDPVGAAEPTYGIAAAREFFLGIPNLMRDLTIKADHMEITADLQEVIVKWSAVGTSLGGKVVQFDGFDLFEMDDTAKIKVIKAYWQPETMVSQLQ